MVEIPITTDRVYCMDLSSPGIIEVQYSNRVVKISRRLCSEVKQSTQLAAEEWYRCQ